jgi:hypothetical protein
MYFQQFCGRCGFRVGTRTAATGNRVQLKYDGTRWRRDGKWRGNWRMQWVASTLHTTSEHGVSSITTADAHTSAASSRLKWLPRRLKLTRPFCRKTKFGFSACAITFHTLCTHLTLGTAKFASKAVALRARHAGMTMDTLYIAKELPATIEDRPRNDPRTVVSGAVRERGVEYRRDYYSQLKGWSLPGMRRMGMPNIW